MKWAILALLVSVNSFAGLPPTTSYGSGDGSNKVTFNYQFPNFQITHTATTANIDLPNILGSYGTCTNCNLSYDIKGRLVAASNGTGGGGGSTLSVVTKTANYTMTNSDDVILVDASSGSIAITLQSSASATLKRYSIQKIDSSLNLVTISSADLLNGESSQVIGQQYQSLDMIPNGSTWYVF